MACRVIFRGLDHGVRDHSKIEGVPRTLTYQQKLNHPDYYKRKDSGDLNKLFDGSLIERQIKSVRGWLAITRTVPADLERLPIPLVVTVRPKLDGIIEESEWKGAIRFSSKKDPNVTYYLQSDAFWLFIGCDALDEKTEHGMDGLRVYPHTGLTPELVNEQVHLGKDDDISTARQTNIYWDGPVSDDSHEQWKNIQLMIGGFLPMQEAIVYSGATGSTSWQSTSVKQAFQ